MVFNPSEEEKHVMRMLESKLNLNLDIMKIVNTSMKTEIYLEEILSDNQRALLHYNHRYLLTHD